MSGMVTKETAAVAICDNSIIKALRTTIARELISPRCESSSSSAHRRRPRLRWMRHRDRAPHHGLVPGLEEHQLVSEEEPLPLVPRQLVQDVVDAVARDDAVGHQPALAQDVAVAGHHA